MNTSDINNQENILLQTTAPRLGVIYSRVLTIQSNFSIYHQDAELTDYCQKNNIEIVGKFVDISTGGDMDRPELQKMLQSLKPGYCVICASVSRLARKLQDLLSICEKIKESGSSLIVLDINFPISSPEGNFLLSINGSISDFEYECKRNSTSADISLFLSERLKFEN